MNALNENTLNFIKSEFSKVQFKISQNDNGREGVDLLIGNSELYLQSIDLDTQRSIKIPKEDLGEPNDNLFVALVLVMNNEPQGFYLIPSKQLSQPDNYIFFENEVSSFPSLSNWEIKVFTNAFTELNKFSFSNMIDKLKT